MRRSPRALRTAVAVGLLCVALSAPVQDPVLAAQLSYDPTDFSGLWVISNRSRTAIWTKTSSRLSPLNISPLPGLQPQAKSAPPPIPVCCACPRCGAT